MIKSESDKNIKLSSKDFIDVDVEYCLNTWISFRFNAPVEYSDHYLLYQYYPVVYFLAEAKFLKGEVAKCMEDMKILCSDKDVHYTPLQ